MAEHMEQSAACAVEDKAEEPLVIAALLHDIGHFIGAILAQYYPPEISEPVRLHVPAKRYLCTVAILQYLGVEVPETMKQPCFV